MKTFEFVESVKAVEPAITVSKHYNMFRTTDVVKMAAAYGWNPVQQKQAKVRKETSIGKQKHIVILEHPEFKTSEGNVNLVIRNSHDGKGSLQIFAGYMRIACSNQLFVKNLGDGMELRITHRSSWEEVDDMLSSFIQKIGQVSGIVDQMKNRELKPVEIKRLAKKALEIRYGNTPNLALLNLDPEKLTTITRQEDQGNSLWVVLNRIQEHIVNGGVSYQTQNKKGDVKIRHLRKLTGLNKSVDVNTKLFEAALALV